MKQRKTGNRKEETGKRKEADDILGNLRALSDSIAEVQAMADREFAELTEKYGALMDPIKTRLKKKEKEIMLLMKAEKADLFDGKDIVRLINGILLYSREFKVSIPRDALEKAEKLGLAEVIKIVKSLNRDIVKAWPDEKLVLIGAERKAGDKFSYEIKKEK